MLEGIASLLEKLPGLSLRAGLVLAAVGVALQWSIGYGFVSGAAFQGYVGESAALLCVVGSAMMVAGGLIAAPERFASLRRAFVRRRSARQDEARLIENVSFLNPDARLILLLMLRLPSGRMESLGDYPPFARLHELYLIEREYGGGVVFINGVSGGMVRVAPSVYRRRNELIPQLDAQLTERIGADLRELEALLGEVDERGNRWARQQGRLRV